MIFHYTWLVVSTYPSEKWWSSSVGIRKFPTEWNNNPFMFQTAKQPFIFHYQRLNHHLVTIQPPFFITMFHHHQINGSTFSQQQPPALLDVAPTGPCLYRAPFLLQISVPTAGGLVMPVQAWGAMLIASTWSERSHVKKLWEVTETGKIDGERCLVVTKNHLEKWWSSSMGRIIPYIVEKHVWNHQPVKGYP